MPVIKKVDEYTLLDKRGVAILDTVRPKEGCNWPFLNYAHVALHFLPLLPPSLWDLPLALLD